MSKATALFSMALTCGWAGCYLAHGLDASPPEDDTRSRDPGPTTTTPAPGPEPTDPGHDICPETPGPTEACECGVAERLPHPDEAGRCFLCRGCATACEIPNPADGPVFSDARLTWQAPGGFAGHGPALIVHAGGLVQAWSETPGFDPASTPAAPPDREIALGFFEVDQLFLRMEAADTAVLPHDGPWVDCYPQIHFVGCEGCAPVEIGYGAPAQIRPELDCVLEWFERLPAIDPGAWCDL